MDSFPAPAFSKKTFGETRADTVESVFLHRPGGSGVSDPRLQKIRIRNNCAGGKAATVAGYVGPGFHNWPSSHIPQDNGSESASPQPAPCQKNVRRRDRGQRPTATKDPKTKRLRRYVNFPTRANGTMTFPVSGHPPCVGTIYLPCVRYQTPITFPVPLPHRVFGTEPPPCFQSHQPEPDSIEIIRHEKLSRFAR